MKYKCKEGMIDNRKVKDNHQEGISRVIQRKGEKGRVGQGGKMNNKPSQKANWRRTGGSLTPRQA